MRSGIAGINIVSAYITITAIELKTMSVLQAYAGTVTDLDITSDGDIYNYKSSFNIYIKS